MTSWIELIKDDDISNIKEFPHKVKNIKNDVPKPKYKNTVVCGVCRRKFSSQDNMYIHVFRSHSHEQRKIFSKTGTE